MWYTDLHNNITCRIYVVYRRSPHTFYMLCCYGDLLYTTYILHVMLLWRSSVCHIHSTCYVVIEIFCISHTFYMLCCYGDLLYTTYILHAIKLPNTSQHLTLNISMDNTSSPIRHNT
jgi:hypothetical protein